MNKFTYRLLNVIVLLALTFGGYVSVGASARSVAAAANIYYVSTSGNDASAGTEIQPWRTIQKAANTAVAGSIIRVVAGNYAERVQVARAGLTFETGGLVTMRGFQITSDNIVVKGFYITDTPGINSAGYGFYISGSNCIIENNYVYYAISGGVTLTPTSSGCVVRNNKFERNSQNGIDVNGKNHLIEDNEIWGSIQYHPKWLNPPTWVDADGIRFFGLGHIFRNNYIHDIHYGIPENVNPHIDCFQTWVDTYHEVASNILFEGNRCINQDAQSLGEIGQGFMIGGGASNEGGANNIVIRNNLILAYRGINAAYSNNLTITNNTFVGKIPKANGLGEYGVFFTGVTGTNLVQNNIFYNIIGTTCNIYGDVSKGNLFYIPPSEGYLRCSPIVGDLWQVDPLFVNPNAGDYHLQASSPAIGTGINRVDFGVFPYGMTSVPATNTPTFTPTNTLAAPSSVPSLTPTSAPLTATPTASLVPVLPTVTATVAQPTVIVTASLVPASPTPTMAPATPTATLAPLLPTATETAPMPIAPTITPTSIPPTAMPISEIIYDNTDSAFVYSAGWKNVSKRQAYNGSYKLTTLNGSFAAFTFTGQSFSILYTGGPAFRKMEVYVDDMQVGVIDEKVSRLSFQQRWNYTGQLVPGTHTLKLVFSTANRSNKTNGSIDAVIVR